MSYSTEFRLTDGELVRSRDYNAKLLPAIGNCVELQENKAGHPVNGWYKVVNHHFVYELNFLLVVVVLTPISTPYVH